MSSTKTSGEPTSASGRSILVLGAGELGKAVLRPLSRRASQAGAQVSVLLRPSAIKTSAPSKRAQLDELRTLGVALVPGDIASASADTLAEIFTRYDDVVSCIGYAAGPGTQLKLARAALQAGVQHYFPWQFGIDYDVLGRGSAQDLFDEQLDVRDMLRGQSRVEWVIISPGMFTSFLFDPDFGVVDLEHDAVHALGGWNNAVTVTTPEDIGEFTAETLFAEPRIRNRVLHLAGDTLTYQQLAELLDRVLGRRMQRKVWDLATLRRDLADDPADGLKKYRVVFAAGLGVAWDPTLAVNHTEGRAFTGAEEWARENLTTP